MTHICLAVLLLLYAGAASAEVMTWQVDGVTGEAIVFAPTASPAGGKNPLVLSFHGRGDNVQNFQHIDLHLGRSARGCSRPTRRSRAVSARRCSRSSHGRCFMWQVNAIRK